MRDERSEALSSRAGELFAAAGSRAFATLDFLTTRDLLGRAAVLLPEGDPRRLDLLPNLAVALTETGRPEETEALLSRAVAHSQRQGPNATLCARTFNCSRTSSTARRPRPRSITPSQKRKTRPRLSRRSGDDVGLAEAAIALDYLEFMRGRVATALEWTYRALKHGLAAGRFREAAQAAADVVGHSAIGPLPFGRFAETAAERLFPLGEPISEAQVMP